MKKRLFIILFFLSVFISVYACASEPAVSGNGNSNESISITITLDKTQTEVGKTVTASYSVTGGSAEYKEIQIG